MVATVAVYDKSLKLSRASLEGPRLGQALNFQVGVVGRIIVSACARKFALLSSLHTTLL